MTPSNRQAKIANLIRQQTRVTVIELANSLSVSKETIRRDLTALARIGKAQKFHGGASLPARTTEGPFHERMGENVIAKALIAARTVKIVSSGETILIDTGSTSLYFAEKLAELSNMTVITNSTEIAQVISLSPNNSQAFLLGGKFNSGNRQTVGNLAISQLQFFRAHHAVLTIGAIDALNGVMDFSIDEAQVAQAMIEQAESLTIIADCSKFDKIASFKVCDLNRITNLVCDRCPTGNLKSALMDAKVNILCVNL